MKVCNCGEPLSASGQCQDCEKKYGTSDEQSGVLPRKGPRAGSADYRAIATQIRLIALRCKNTNTYTCDFGNEFAEKVEEYLRECFPPNKQHDPLGDKTSTEPSGV